MKSPVLHVNKSGFSEIFHCKEFASSRAEKARGCFGSNMVSKIVNICSAQETWISVFRNENFKADEQSL